MGPDIRYHIATLATVLCAVVVGVMVGASLKFPKEYQERENRLRAEFRRVMTVSRQTEQEKNEALQKAQQIQEDNEKLLEGLAPDVVRDKLAGKRFAIVHSAGLTEFTSIKDSLKRLLRLSGAEVASVTEIDPKAAEDEALLETAAQQLKWPQGPPSRMVQLTETMAQVFASGDTGAAFPALARTGVLRIASDYSRPVNGVLLVGGAQESDSKIAEQIDVPFIQSLSTLKVNVVGCELEKAPVSFMPVYIEQRIATVDNIDSPTGQIALIYALAGRRGHYGIKAGASGKLPSLP